MRIFVDAMDTNLNGIDLLRQTVGSIPIFTEKKRDR